VPSAVDHLIQRSEFLTSYTPYQPEISQGTLQVLFEFQTQVALLTGMEVANASLYDGSTGTAEAVLMAQRLTRRSKAILSAGLHPHYAETVETVAGLSGQVHRSPVTPGKAEDIAALIDADTACVVVQSPDVFGLIRDLRPIAEAAHAKGALLVAVVTEIVSLGLLESPGAQGADIVAAEGQSIGNGLNFGGPYVGLFATREKFLRQMPGRLTGETQDVEGRRGYVLTLSTREQHIRREKATSNICTNQALVALMVNIFMTVYGKVGLKELAKQNLAKAAYAAGQLAQHGNVLFSGAPRFNEFVLQTSEDPQAINRRLLRHKIVGGLPLKKFYPELGNAALWCCTELTTRTAIEEAVKLVGEAASTKVEEDGSKAGEEAAVEEVVR
jgi:glycine dehydrogenase subunit 1